MDEICFERRSCLRTNPSFVLGLSFSPVGEKREIWGKVNNISSGGLGVSTVFSIPPETLIDITMAQKPSNSSWEIESFMGMVRWCRSDPIVKETYNIGISSQDLLWPG